VTVNPLFVAAIEAPGAWSGVWIAEDIELIAHGVRNGSWVDGTLGVVGAGLDALALVSDPSGALLQYGVSWLIEHIRPLSEALDWLAGDPGQIASHAQTWAGDRVQVTTLVASWAGKISQWLRSLIKSLRSLSGESTKLAGLIEQIRALLARLASRRVGVGDLNRVRRPGSGPRMAINRGSVVEIARKYGIDLSGIPITIRETTSGVCGITRPDGSVVLCRTAFRSEEDLARTLEHERFHVAAFYLRKLPPGLAPVPRRHPARGGGPRRADPDR
jgi:hypothetical protein